MLRQKLLSSQERFHKIYQERIASADGRKEAMEKDLADFDKGIELLLQGRNRNACRNEMERFLTVYGWIAQRNLPQSFLDHVWCKNINTRLLAKSPNFAYIMGFYQARLRIIHPHHIRIRTCDSSLEYEVEKCFNALHMAPSNKTIVFKKIKIPIAPTGRGIFNVAKTLERNIETLNPIVASDGYLQQIKHSHVLCYSSVMLMSYISEITENNSRIPHSFFIPNLMKAYLSGFCDAHSSPTYYKSKPKCSSIIRKYPRVVITKQGNVPLLSAVNSALNFLGIASVYNTQRNPDQIYILALESIKKFIDLGIYRSREKLGKLKELYDCWKDTNELDRHGAYQKLKDEIRMQRDENRPDMSLEKIDENASEETEFGESEPTDEDILEED